eukprot:CAMPEP_0113694082 /NCGR_PEP_ID=MMETSP0038_2-20120614/20061_1 /TAXON_ID=2898 /ORGANISM="Cryptomonas paramecium" /LENGTH=237 /DNA_ID=CAMNT_0000616303 /DNA_START=56 /DNA_END=766 /DNA_ORIENTATION=+ /assembly_acc=CAM_ASM_000170
MAKVNIHKARTALLEKQVVAIYASKFMSTAKMSQTEKAALLASRYNVNEKTIRDIWRGRTWRHLTSNQDLNCAIIERVSSSSSRDGVPSLIHDECTDSESETSRNASPTPMTQMAESSEHRNVIHQALPMPRLPGIEEMVALQLRSDSSVHPTLLPLTDSREPAPLTQQRSFSSLQMPKLPPVCLDDIFHSAAARPLPKASPAALADLLPLLATPPSSCIPVVPSPANWNPLPACPA